MGKLMDAGRYWIVLKAVAMEFLKLGMGPALIIYSMLAGGFEWEKARTPLSPGILILLLMGFGYGLIYILTPHSLEYHLSTSLYRLVIHLWPSAVLLFFVAVREPSWEVGKRLRVKYDGP